MMKIIANRQQKGMELCRKAFCQQIDECYEGDDYSGFVNKRLTLSKFEGA
jgi:hypothetical protein